VDNIGIDLGEGDGMNWIGVVQNRDEWRAFVKVVRNFEVPQNAGKFLNGCITGGPWNSTQLHIVSWLVG
jgi:hypothetical protein